MIKGTGLYVLKHFKWKVSPVIIAAKKGLTINKNVKLIVNYFKV